MDLTSLYYFSEVAKDLHITRTASRLYISQQTLSNHILRLEEQFGTPLLNRKPKLSLTYAGEFVLSFTDVVMKEHRNLTDILSDMEQSERGTIRFGASTLRANILPFIFPTFISRYPNVELRLTSVISRELEPMVSKGELDFALVITDKSDHNLLQEELMQDIIYLCVTDGLLKSCYEKEEVEAMKERSLAGARLKDFSRLPFCSFSNQMGRQIQQCFEEAGYRPRVRFTTSHTQIATSLGFQGSMAFFANHTTLTARLRDIPDDLNIFPLLLHDEPTYLTMSLLRHKQRYLTHASKYFLELISSFCTAIEHTSVARLAAAPIDLGYEI